MDALLYFAYGSNMSVRRLRARIRAAEPIGPARLAQHRLAFHKRSLRDGSAKCDIIESPGDVVHGLLWRLPAAAWPELDRIEGVGQGYVRETIALHGDDGRPVQALCYRATLTDARLQPYSWYKQHVLIGAGDAGAPASYIEMITRVSATEDPDPARARRELAIYRSAG